MRMEDMIIVSVDDHVVEPVNMFDAHLSAEHRKLAPSYVLDDQGRGFWWWEHEQKKAIVVGSNAVVGRPKEEYGLEPQNLSEMRPGVWDAKAHIDDMNAAGILGSVLFPSFPHFCGQFFWSGEDKANNARVIAAYNDWLFDEWCGPYKGRYILTGLLPLFDINATMKEARRLIDKGARSFIFPANPARLGLPNIHDPIWEPLFALCNDAKVVLNCHIGTGATPEHPSMDTAISAWIITMPMAIANDAAGLLHLEALHRYPDLKISLAESGIGWVPYFLERADYTFNQHNAWVKFDWHGKKPSDVFREHFLTCFIDDHFGCKNFADVGENIISYECDYPHSDCTWPDVPEKLWKNVSGLSDTLIEKITHRNAMDFFQYDPFAVLGKENCTVAALRAQARDVDVSVKPVYNSTRKLGRTGHAVTSGEVLAEMA